jgi:hypothetical protein
MLRTFQGWADLGYYVKKGTKAIWYEGNHLFHAVQEFNSEGDNPPGTKECLNCEMIDCSGEAAYKDEHIKIIDGKSFGEDGYEIEHDLDFLEGDIAEDGTEADDKFQAKIELKAGLACSYKMICHPKLDELFDLAWKYGEEDTQKVADEFDKLFVLIQED